MATIIKIQDSKEIYCFSGRDPLSMAIRPDTTFILFPELVTYGHVNNEKPHVGRWLFSEGRTIGIVSTTAAKFHVEGFPVTILRSTLAGGKT